jgi:predicted SAM-dependent methyltransferase
VQRDLDRLLAGMRRGVRLGLHLGAGGERIEGLVNCDAFDPRAERRVDARDLREFADGSVDWIENHHMLEHLSFADAERAVAEWARALRPGGVLVVTCPDLGALCRRWIRQVRWERFRRRPDRLAYTLRMFCGSQENEGMFHRSAYDRKRLEELLARHGIRTEFAYTPYPRRPTPSLLVIARRG